MGERFRARPSTGEEVELELELTRCAETPYGDPSQWLERFSRVPFSVTFLSADGRLAPQQIFRLEHPGLGAFDLFMVPLGPDPERGGMRYEAIIS
jgi:hypothetical protein